MATTTIWHSQSPVGIRRHYVLASKKSPALDSSKLFFGETSATPPEAENAPRFGTVGPGALPMPGNCA